MTAAAQRARLRGLVRKELQEYPNALWRTPWVMVGLVALLMFANAIFIDRINLVGDALLEMSGAAVEGKPGLSIAIGLGDRGLAVSPPAPPLPPSSPAAPTAAATGAVVTVIADSDVEPEWDFARDWDPSALPERESSELHRTVKRARADGGTPRLNPLFNAVHALFILVLFVVSINYLLGSLFHDRRDGSVLFWRSMPVSPLQEVGVRMLVACLVAPAFYIVASWLAQLFVAAAAALVFTRQGIAPLSQLLASIDFLDLLGTQVMGWLLTAAMLSPVYAWCLLASALARRAPLFLALTPPLVLILAERILLGTNHTFDIVQNHLPHYTGSDNVMGFYLFGWQELSVKPLPLLGGMGFAGAAMVAAAALRRYRSIT